MVGQVPMFVQMCVCARVHVSLYQSINGIINLSPFLAPWLGLSLRLSPSFSIYIFLCCYLFYAPRV